MLDMFCIGCILVVVVLALPVGFGEFNFLLRCVFCLVMVCLFAFGFDVFVLGWARVLVVVLCLLFCLWRMGWSLVLVYCFIVLFLFCLLCMIFVLIVALVLLVSVNSVGVVSF